MEIPNGDTKVKPSDTRKYVEIIIGKELKGSPLVGMESTYVKFGEEYKVDPLLAVAISFHESAYCKAYANWHNVQYKNCAGIMNGGQENGLVEFESYEAFIETHFKLLAKYIYKYDRNTIEKIGNSYAPVSSHFLNKSWVGSVSKKYHKLWELLE